MFDHFEPYNVHAESAEIEKWSILSTRVNYVQYKGKVLHINRVNFNPTVGRYQKGYKQIKGDGRTCQDKWII